VACFLAGTDTLLAKATVVGSRSRAQNPDGTLANLALPRGLEPLFSP
jgi:hypothetical protein